MRCGAAVAIVALVLIGCTKKPSDDGDGGQPPVDDGDGDGLCDATEEMLGSDPAVADTDHDGLGDFQEAVYGYDPTRTDSPAREDIAILNESASSTMNFSVRTFVYASGETYTGGFAPDLYYREDDLDASSFYVDSIALGALPRENVFEVRAQEEQFVAVNGDTELLFEVELAFGPVAPRGCTRAYPWRYEIKRDQTLIAAPRFLLVVVPEGQDLSTAESCVPAGPCF